MRPHSPNRKRAPGRNFVARACKSLALMALGVLALAIHTAAPTAAQSSKRVGVVFDDSGSMKGRSNLPVFGIQALAGSLSSGDALYGLTFKQFFAGQGPRRFDIASDTAQQGSIDTLRQWAINPSVNTPYAPVERMLAHLVGEAKADDDVHLFVFTDGAFNTVPDAASLDAAYQRFKQQIEAKRARLTAHFIAFEPNQGVQQAIRQQQVASTLARVFNGDEARGVHFIDNAEQLRRELVRIVATIAETEPEGVGQSIVRGTDRVTVTPPFTVTRVVVVSYAPVGQTLPRLTDWPQRDRGKSPPRELISRMDTADTVAAAGIGADTRWQASIAHMEYLPAIEAGKPFQLVFDRPITDETRILFRSDVKLAWDVYDPSGARIAPEADGTVVIGTQQDYEIRARLSHRDPADPTKQTPTRFDHISDTQFFFLPDGGPRQSMQIDKANHYATFKVRETQAGTRSAAVSVVAPGFVTRRSGALRIKIEETSFVPRLETEPLVAGCTGCSPSRAEMKLTPAEPFKPAMKVTASFPNAAAGLAGEIEVRLQNPLPPGTRIVLPGGGILEGARTNAKLPASAAEKIEMIAEVDGKLLSTLPDGHRVLMTVAAVRPLTGSSSTNFVLAPRPEDARLVPSGTTDGAVGDTPFKVKPERLDGKSGFYIKVEKPYGVPSEANFRVDIAGLQADIVQQPQKDIVLVRPRPTWCPCLVRAGRYDVRVAFKNEHGQATTLDHHMIVDEVTWWERFLLCLWLILTILAAIWLLMGLYRLLTSHRFPRRARLESFPTGKPQDADFRRLAQRPWPWLRPFVWPWSGIFDERCDIAGMRLEAMNGGVRVLPRGKSAEAYSTLHRGGEHRSMAQMFKAGMEEIEVYWGTPIVDRGPDKTTYRPIERRGN